MRQRATRMGGNRAPAALAARVAALMASFAGPKVWFDPSDISTLFQDSAGTTPVAVAGDGIGRILDKSGAGNHATQVTTPSRPLWQTTYAAFDGTDDSWATPSIDFTGTDKLTMIVGLRKVSDSSTGVVCENSASPETTPGAVALLAPALNGTNKFSLRLRGTSAYSEAMSTSAAFNAPISAVVSAQCDLGAPRNDLRVNGVSISTLTTPIGAISFSNQPFYIGRRNNASLPFNGNLYGLIIIGRLLSPDELWVCERYMAQQAGITI